jgi:hypothetical protein
MIDFEQMINGVNMVKVGVFGRLSSRFRVKYGEEKGNLLAAAVTNELFSSPSLNRKGKKFLKSNRETVQKELSDLRNDDEIRNAVTQAVRVKVIISQAQSNQAKESLLSPLEKLKELGILVSGGETPSPNTFLPMASRFYKLIAGKKGEVTVKENELPVFGCISDYPDFKSWLKSWPRALWHIFLYILALAILCGILASIDLIRKAFLR